MTNESLRCDVPRDYASVVYCSVCGDECIECEEAKCGVCGKPRHFDCLCDCEVDDDNNEL